MEESRIHVERIVRPIRASGGRKNKMREELLAHLEQRVTVARERGMPQDDAVAFAQENLGDPAQLRAELQATVPVVERASFIGVNVAVLDAWFDKREGETALHFAWVRTVYTSLFVLAALIPLVAAMDGAGWLKILTGQTAWDWNSKWAVKHCYVPLLLVCSSAVATFAAYYVADVTGLRRRLSNRVATGLFFRVVSLEVFVGGYLLLFGALAAYSAFITQYPASSSLLPPPSDTFLGVQSIGLILAPSVALLILVGLPFVAWAINKEHEQYEKWGRLKVDD